ncbi:lipocalin family protein [Taibaiella soli]|uniref:Lipocalin-like domain-containing protein n=1 Tax=Taibaiella soli TaxID=1649169 RepID=A0A2W2AGA8_9BACT|nr:lipocalin family protein [Taibaiella soli]PZF74291.1 hypothetical protein DN068_04590 [Taibaiella soli]
MKKLVLAASIMGIAFASCKKNDDNGGGNNSTAIVAKWNFNTVVSTTSIGGVSMGTDTTDVTGSYMDFRSDGKVYSMIVDTLFGNEYDTSSYKVNGNNITITSTTDTSTAQIVSLTSNAMELYTVDEEIQGGVTATSKQWAYYTK